MYVKWRPLALWLVVIGIGVAVDARQVSAQSATASVTGSVRDASEAVVPGATVEIRNHDTNQVWQSITDERGRFRLLYLPVGDYHLSVQLTGFITANANLTLAVGRTAGVVVSLIAYISQASQSATTLAA